VPNLIGDPTMNFARLLLPLPLAASLCAHAQQGVSLATGFTDFTTWSLYGSATASNMTPGNGFTYSDLMLTAPGVGGQGGAGFAPNAIALDFNQAFAFDFDFDFDGHFITSAVPVPEPGSWTLILAGLACLAMLARRRRAR
jgi:hypothetical protein